jgi:hypothetical protein
MSKIATLLLLAISLTACGAYDTMVSGWQHAKAVENDLAKSTGMTPQVGFHWSNGQLGSVTVQFPEIYDAKPLGDLAAIVRRAVLNEFKQAPKNIVLAFALENIGVAAQLHAPPANASAL